VVIQAPCSVGVVLLTLTGTSLFPGDGADFCPVSDTVAVAERVLLLGDDDQDPAGLFVQISGIAVDSGGRFAVLDRSLRNVRLFSGDGELLERFGRTGQGPGEFRDPVGVAFGRDGTLSVLDPGNDRITVFGVDGALRQTVPLRSDETEERIVGWQQIEPGTVLERVWSSELEGASDRLRIRLLPEDTVPTIAHLEYQRPHNPRSPSDPIELLGARPEWTASPDGFVAWSFITPGAEPRMWVRHPSGHLAQSTVEGHSSRPIRADERTFLMEEARRGWAELLGRDLDEISPLTDRFVLPDSLPALTGLFGLEGGPVLVQSFHGVDELDGGALFSYFNLPLGGGRWTLVAPNGSVLGPVDLPSGFVPWATKGELLYGVEVDEYRVERLAVYRLDRMSESQDRLGRR